MDTTWSGAPELHRQANLAVGLRLEPAKPPCTTIQDRWRINPPICAYSCHIRVQLAVNGTLVERGTDVTLSGDFTFAFSWQIYLNENDYVEVHVSTSGSRDLVAEWTKASMHQLDYLEAV